MTGRGQLDLFGPSQRRHDLPPRWDGDPVEWRGWRTSPAAFICPPPKPECCHRCGSMTPNVYNVGTVRHQLELHGPLARRTGAQAGQIFVATLTAFRCPDCGHDQVLQDFDTWWDLDPTDYVDEGSVAL